MDERIGFALFFAIFVAVYGLLNYFVLSQYAKLFRIQKTHWFYIILAILTLSYVLAAAFESSSNTSLFRAFYIAASTWMGVLFLSFCLLLLYFILDKLTPITNWITGIVILLVVLIATVYGIVNADTLTVKELNITNDKNATLKIVQITDVHLGPVNGQNYLERIVKKINAAKPDVVLITGDLIDGRYKYDPKLFLTLNEIKAPIYFSSGNHEGYAGLETVRILLNDTKARWLRNEQVAFKNINIIGLDDSGSKKFLNEILYNITKDIPNNRSNKFTILMNHRPLGWEYASNYVDLMLSGHTHGGQIWPFTYISWMEGHAVNGVYRMPGNGRFMLYVSPGTGTWGPPMRIGSSTEITVFNLVGDK